MKSITNFLLCLAGAVSFHFAQSQNVDEIISKHLEARGGLDKIRTIQAIIMEGTMSQQGNEIVLKFYNVHNKSSRVEFSVMGQTGYNIATTTEGWVFNPFAGNTAPEAMPEPQLKTMQTQLDIQGGLVDYKAKGSTVEYLGKESQQGTEYHKLKFTNAAGKTTTYYLDKNYLIAKSVTTAMVQGSEQEVATEYSDYRKTPEGLLFAFKRITPNGEVTLEKIQVNPNIDEALFKPTN